MSILRKQLIIQLSQVLNLLGYKVLRFTIRGISPFVDINSLDSPQTLKRSDLITNLTQSKFEKVESIINEYEVS